jgi:hypothetical protein
MIIRVSHMRAAGVCADARHWFAREGLDWRDFVRNGIEEEKLLATGNAIAARVVEVARNGR